MRIGAGPLGCLPEALHVDADGKALDPGASPADREHLGGALSGAEFLNEAPPQVVGILLGLHADQVVIGNRPQELAAAGKGPEHLWGGPGDVVKVPDRVRGPERPQLCRERDQMVVVNPHEIVGPQQPGERARERAIDP